MATNDVQFTNVLLDSPSNIRQSTSSFNNNNTGTIKSNKKVFKSKWFPIFMIVLSFILLIICIVLSITLAIISKSIKISSRRSMTITNSQTNTTILIRSNEICGIQEITPNSTLSRIYGGNEAIPNSWPWMVFYIEYSSCNESDCPVYVCGGTLIDPRYVLTAAHCVDSINDSLIRIYGGMHDITSATEFNNRQIRNVEKVFIHPTFNKLAPIGDIAIVQLSAPFYLNKYVQLACLPTIPPTINDTLIIIGWGRDTYDGDPGNVLKQAFTQIVDDCNKWWSYDGIDERRQICIANNKTGASACSGDSGGPLLFKHQNQWIVSGIGSYIEKSRCNTTNSRPNVYTRVDYYLPWINNIIQSQFK